MGQSGFINGMIVALLLLAVCCVHAQPPPVPVRGKVEGARLYVGLELYDAVRQGLHPAMTYRAAERVEVTASLGYTFWRSYRYQHTLRGQVHGGYGGVGIQWRLSDGGRGAWLLGGRLTLGQFAHRTKAVIPNYYGDVVYHYRFVTGYLSPQLVVGRSYLLGRWRLEAGMRISLCEPQFWDVSFHSYLPAVGRVNMLSREHHRYAFVAVYPFVRMSLPLGK